jgi:hypothetical protein
MLFIVVCLFGRYETTTAKAPAKRVNTPVSIVCQPEEQMYCADDWSWTAEVSGTTAYDGVYMQAYGAADELSLVDDGSANLVAVRFCCYSAKSLLA